MSKPGAIAQKIYNRVGDRPHPPVCPHTVIIENSDPRHRYQWHGYPETPYIKTFGFGELHKPSSCRSTKAKKSLRSFGSSIIVTGGAFSILYLTTRLSSPSSTFRFCLIIFSCLELAMQSWFSSSA